MCPCRHVRRWSNLPSRYKDLQRQCNYLLVQYGDLVSVGPVTCEVEWYWKCHSRGYLMLFWRRYRCGFHPFADIGWWYCHQETHTKTDRGYWYRAARGMTDSLPLCKCLFFFYISHLHAVAVVHFKVQCIALDVYVLPNAFLVRTQADTWYKQAY